MQRNQSINAIKKTKITEHFMNSIDDSLFTAANKLSKQIYSRENMMNKTLMVFYF